MSVPVIVVLVVLIIPLALVSINKMRLDLAGLITAVSLAGCQLAGIPVLGKTGDADFALRALDGLSQPVTITLFSLFIVTSAIERSGLTRWFASRIILVAGNSESKVIGLLAATSAFFSLFMNNLAAGLLVLPAAMNVSSRLKIKPSKLLIPVAYGSCLGGAATYFTTNNIIASDMLRLATPSQRPLGIFDFTPVGSLVAISGVLFLAFFGKRILPDREASSEQSLARQTGSELEAVYELDQRLWEVQIPASSPMSGKKLIDMQIGEKFGLTVVAVLSKKSTVFAPNSDQIVPPESSLLVVGRQDRIVAMQQAGLLSPAQESHGSLSTRGASFIEVVLIPGSRAEGQSLKSLKFRNQYGLSAVALRRAGRSYRTDVAEMKLERGDSLLLVGARDRINALKRSPNFLVIETDQSDQPVNWKMATGVLTMFLSAVVAAMFGVPVWITMIAAATLLILFELVSMDEIYRRMEWQAIVLIAGMYPLSTAIVQTGIAENLGAAVVSWTLPYGPLGLIAGAYVLTALLSQVIAGQVTTLITAPVFISAAVASHTNPQAVAVTTAIACSASFLTPMSHPVSALMIGPANYKFWDFFRAGWALSIISFIMLLIGMKLFWVL